MFTQEARRFAVADHGQIGEQQTGRFLQIAPSRSTRKRNCNLD
jgi:hypothetical protein